MSRPISLSQTTLAVTSGREVPGQEHDAGPAQRLVGEVGRVGLQLGQRLLGGHGRLQPDLEAGVVVGQGLGEHAGWPWRRT